MMPHSHSYAADMQTKSTQLAAAVAAAFSPPQISAACAAVESYLSTHTPEQLRWFFSITFPTLICRVFGFDDASPSPQMSRAINGWIDVAVSENEAELAGKIFSLLSPNGVLLSSIHVVDRLSLVKYVFPVERLPMWIQYVLQNVRDYSAIVDLCPLLNNRVKQNISKGYSYQVHLNLFEYYMFWFAYYPVCRGSSEGSESVKVQRPKKFKLENWTNSFPSLSSTKRGTEKKTETNFYLKLLYAYLHSFVVINTEGVQVQRPYRSSLLQYSSGNDNSTEQAAFVVHTFMNFWLLDNDFSPLPERVCKSLGALSPLMSALCETPPTSRLADAANVFVQYLNLTSIPAMADSNQLDHVGNLGWRVSGSFNLFKSSAIPSVHSVGSSISLIQRPLYRFILRTFLFSPAESSIMNASQTFTLWVNYMEPWSNKFEEFSDLDELVGFPNRNSVKDVTKSSQPQYSSMWQGYILTNYLFYSSLIVHFIGFAHKFLHIDADVVIQMVVKVMNILTCTSELMDLIKNIDAVYHSKSAGLSKSVLTTLNSFVPTIRGELQDWEYGLCESDADGSFLHENWNRDLQLFADGEDGGRHLFQLFLLRAETELQSTSGSNLAQNLQRLDSLKTQLNRLFGIPVTKLSSGSLGSKHCQKSHQDVFKPRGLGNQMGVEIKYRGDTMKRPISDDEITWLAKLLVRLSCWINESLGLNQINCTHQTHVQSYVEVPSGLRTVHGSSELVKIVMQSLLSWVTWLCGAGVQYMKNHGLRVNLRILASKKIIVMVLVFCAYGILKNVCIVV